MFLPSGGQGGEKVKSEKLKVKSKSGAKASKAQGKKKTARSKKKKTSKIKSQTSLSPINLKALLEAGCHFGHRVAKTHPKSKVYLYGKRGGVQIFDLIQTGKLLDKARNFLVKLASRGEKVLLVGTKRQARKAVRRVARESGMPFVNNRWLGGTLTNWSEMSKRIKRLEKLQKQMEAGSFARRTKREQSLIRKEIFDLKVKFEGLSSLKNLPSALVVVDIVREKIAVTEARTAGIQIVAITDSNTDPTLVDYPIPANDDARKSIELITEILGEAILFGKQLDTGSKKENKNEKE